MILTATLISNNVSEIMKYVDILYKNDIPDNERIKSEEILTLQKTSINGLTVEFHTLELWILE